MLGEKVSADRAKEVGLVSSLHDNHEEMMKNAFEIAEKLASKTPLAMWVTKETLNYSRDHTVKESLEKWKIIYFLEHFRPFIRCTNCP